MKSVRLALIPFVVPILVIATQAQDAKAGIAKATEKFMSELKAGNAAGISALYTEDAMAFPPGADTVKGRAEIQKFWQGMVDQKIHADLQMSEVETHGNTAVETGTFVIKDATGNPVDRGKYIVVWKRGKSGWQLHRDIWNSSMPPPAK
jgi:ketosteroid isomerase-like protein